MAQTFFPRKLRAVGTVNGGPPIVRQLFNGPVAVAAGDVLTWDISGGELITSTLINAGTDDKIDADVVVAKSANGDKLAGVAMATIAIDTVGPVAVFGPNNIFEGTLTSTDDGTTSPVTPRVSAATDMGTSLALCSIDTGISSDGVDLQGNTIAHTTPNGLWVLTTVATGTTPSLANTIVEIGYGFAGEDNFSGHGEVGDSNVRVRFVTDAQYTLFG